MKHSIYYNRFTRLITAALICGTISFAFSQQPNIPNLNWTERSDWVNVKTDVTPKAVGNGVADDADAIQAALDQLGYYPAAPAGSTQNPNKVAYLPEGTYRITKTLLLRGHNGGMVIGHGRNTRIFWDGPANGVMFWDDGSTQVQFKGITYDGNNKKAGVGFDHNCMPGGSYKFFDCANLHEHEAYINLKTGIRYREGEKNGGMASSETMNRNCLYMNCDTGAIVGWANYINILFQGDEFRSCKTGIYSGPMGDVKIADCHFENSTICDIDASTANGCWPIIMRCTSYGSAMFARATGPLQDCHVSNWTGANGAVSYVTMAANRNPVTIFDCSFDNPPSGGGTPVRFGSGLGAYSLPIRIIHSNNTIGGASATQTALISYTGTTSPLFYTIPKGARNTSGASGLDGKTHLTAQTSFLDTAVSMPTRILDITAFGARQSNTFDSKAAFQAAIDSAAKLGARSALGSGPVVYIPGGGFTINSTVIVRGGNYSILGQGSISRIYWGGTNSASIMMFLVSSPQHITMGFFAILGYNGPFVGTQIMQVDTGTTPSYMTYDYIECYAYEKAIGLLCKNLLPKSVVHVKYIKGDNPIVYENCSRATILTNFQNVANSSDETKARAGFVVRGAQYERSGFNGILAMNGDFMVQNNQNLVTGQTSSEASKVVIQGADGEPTNGHVTMFSKSATSWSPDTLPGPGYFNVLNYAGRVSHIGCGVKSYYQRGTRPVSIVMGACNFWSMGKADNELWHMESGATASYFGNSFGGGGRESWVRDTIKTNTYTDAALALDDGREMGAWDLCLNYGIGCDQALLPPYPGVAVNPQRAFAPMAQQISIAGRMIHLPDAQKYSVEIYNARGALVNTVNMQGPGNMALPLSKTSGVFMIKVGGTGANAFVKKMVRM